MAKKTIKNPKHRYNREDEERNKRRGMMVSIGMHLLLAILLTINPPFGFVTENIAEEQGAYVLLGEDLIGQDSYQEVEETVEETKVEETPEQVPEEAPSEEEILTQDTEDAPTIEEEKPKEESKTDSEPEKPEEKPEEPQEEKEPEKPTSKPNEFLFTKKTSTGTSGQEGSQGKQDGSNDGTAMDGFNLGKGNGSPDGVSFSLAGRQMLDIKPIQDETQEEGIVVVSVVVDRQGKVISVRAGVAGTTTPDPVLWRKAEDAARKAVFNKAPDATATQSGTITFNFKLK